MPEEKRDYATGAMLFIPTQSEKATKENTIRMKKGLQEIDEMKAELRSLINEAKKK